MTTTNTIAAQPQPTAPKTLDEEISFSWGNVARRWGENLKRGIDPALTGMKGGVYALHGIPTWHREYKEGKMRSPAPVLSVIMGSVVLAIEGLAYKVAYDVATSQVAANGLPEQTAYAVAGIPIVANLGSWAYEALYSAKKSEHHRVITQRIQKGLEANNTGYDLNLTQLQERVVKRINERQTAAARGRKGAELADENIELVDPNGKAISAKDAAREVIYNTAHFAFEGMIADKTLGKPYEMSMALRTGPLTRSDKQVQYHDGRTQRVTVGEEIAAVIREHNGAANIELFGQMTLVNGIEGEKTHYAVTPNKAIWK